MVGEKPTGDKVGVMFPASLAFTSGSGTLADQVMVPPTMEKPAKKVAKLLSAMTRTRRLQPIFHDAGPRSHFHLIVSIFSLLLQFQ